MLGRGILEARGLQLLASCLVVVSAATDGIDANTALFSVVWADNQEFLADYAKGHGRELVHLPAHLCQPPD
jgi:hypothetical protein